MMNITTNPDVTWSDHGSITLVTPLSQAAKAWVNHNVPEGMWHGASLVVEPRYLENLLDGMQRDDLIVA